MSNLPATVKSLPLGKIVVPGTHNSGAYLLDLDHCITDSSSSYSPYLKIVQKLHFLPGLSCSIAKVTLCQDCNIYDQLMMGVRFLDIRLSYRDNNPTVNPTNLPTYDVGLNNFYLTHTFTCITLNTALNDIIKFVQSHPDEVIVLAVQPDYEHTSTMLSAYNILKSTLLPYLVPVQNIFPSLNTINASGKSIVLSYENEMDPYCWNFSLINSIWFNTDEISVLQTDITTFPFGSSIYNVCQAILTPQVKDVLMCNTLSSFARLVWSNLFRNNSKNNYKKFSVILTDFMNEEKIKYIISLNTS